MKLQKNTTDSARHWVVLDEQDRFLGTIDEVQTGQWRSTHVTEDGEVSPVPIGPYENLDAAFRAFSVLNTAGA